MEKDGRLEVKQEQHAKGFTIHLFNESDVKRWEGKIKIKKRKITGDCKPSIARAFAMFKEGKSTIDVVIALGIDPDEAKVLHTKYVRLCQGLDEKIEKENETSFMSFEEEMRKSGERRRERIRASRGGT